MKMDWNFQHATWPACAWRGLFVAGLVLMFLTPISAQEMREWVDSTGAYKIQAKFVSLADGKVTLAKADGSQIEVPLDKLSTGDKGYAQAQHAMAGANPFQPKPAANPFAGSALAPVGTGGTPRELKSQLFTAKQIPLVGQGEWNLEVGAPMAADVSMKPIPLPQKTDFFEKVTGVCLSRNGRFAVVGYQLAKHNETPKTTLAFCDLLEGTLLGSGVLQGTNFRPIAVHDSGTKVVMCRNEFGFGKNDRLEFWNWTPGGIQREAEWVPYDDVSGGDRDVKWAAYLDETRLATVNSKGQLIVWDAATAKGVYRIGITGTPALSPDGKYIAFLADKQVGAMDAATGALVTLQNCPSLSGGRVTFTPSGARLIGANANNVLVWDFATGELQRETRAEGMAFNSLMVAPSEEHVLGDTNRLYDFVNQVIVWQYQGPQGAVVAGDVCLLAVVGRQNQPAALVPTNLPHPGVNAKLTEALSAPDFFIFKPGTTVKLDLSKIPDSSQRTKVQDMLVEKLAERDCKAGASGKINLVAEVEDKGKKELKYRTMGRGFGYEEYKITEYVCHLKFVYGGKEVWKTHGTNLPGFFVHLNGDETMKDYIKKRNKPNYEFFSRVSLPKLLTKQAGQGALGSSEVTVSGVR